MATVVSLTAEKIQELLAGWEGVELTQDEINSLVGQILVTQDSHAVSFDFFNNIVVPQLQADAAANSTAVSGLNDLIPDLNTALEDHQAQIDNIRDVDLVGLQTVLDNNVENVENRPKVYVQDEAPTDPDEDDRGLVVGDVWFDSNDQNRQRIWNGVAWDTFAIDIPDLSLTVKKFNTSTHMIY